MMTFEGRARICTRVPPMLLKSARQPSMVRKVMAMPDCSVTPESVCSMPLLAARNATWRQGEERDCHILKKGKVKFQQNTSPS